MSCYYRGMVLDAHAILERFTIPPEETFPEEADLVEVVDPPDESAVEELQSLLDKWCAKQRTKIMLVTGAHINT